MSSTITLLLLLFITVLSHNPELPPPQLRITLVTAWWPEENQQNSLPLGDDLAAFERLLKLPYNLIVFGDKPLAKFVSQKRQSSNTVFFEQAASVLKQSWYNKLARSLKSQNKIAAADPQSSVLSYSRMILLGKAGENDKFNTDQFIWVDHNSLKSAHISNILDPKHLRVLFQAFSHHFFMVPVKMDSKIHVLPGIEQTLFFEIYDTFVSSQIFGGKVQTISTVKALYEDMLKVILEYDKKLWNEDVILGLLADRFPFTVSYMMIEFETPLPASRLLEEDNYLDLEQQYQEIKHYEWMFELCQLGFIVTGILIAFEVFKYLNYKKQLLQINYGSQFQMEPTSAQVSAE